MVNSKFRSIDSSSVAKKVEELVYKNLLNNPNSIFKSKNYIQAFRIYSIHRFDNVYTIYKNNVDITCTFSAKSALAWCVADKYCVKSLKEKILHYDSELASRNATIAVLKNTIHHVSETSRITVLEDKLQDTLYKARHTKNLLDKCINSAKYYQLKGFENETSRHRLKTSN